MATKRQREDSTWYMGAMADLYEKFGNCDALIGNERVLGTYPTFADACRAAGEKCGPGSYIVQETGPDESAYTDSFASLWVVA